MWGEGWKDPKVVDERVCKQVEMEQDGGDQ